MTMVSCLIKTTAFQGWFLVVVGCIFFFWVSFLLLSYPNFFQFSTTPFCQQFKTTGSYWLEWDFLTVGWFSNRKITSLTPKATVFSYYCFLVPLTLPITVVFVYFHWLSMQLFKHA